MPLAPGMSPLSLLMRARGIGPAVPPGGSPGAGPSPAPSPNPLAALMGGPSPGAPAPEPNNILMNRLLGRRLKADPEYVKGILKQTKMVFAHLIPYTAETEGTDMSKDMAMVFRQIETMLDKLDKSAQPITPPPINFSGAQSAGGQNANITPVNSVPVTGGITM